METLPIEIIQHIYSFLSVRDKISLCLTSVSLCEYMSIYDKALINWHKNIKRCMIELPKWYRIKHFTNCINYYSTARRPNRYVSYEYNASCGLFMITRYDNKSGFVKKYVRNWLPPLM